MLIKRLEGVQAAKNAAADPNAQETHTATPAAQTSPYASPVKSAHNTEVMPGTGTAPLPRNTVLQGRYDVEEVLGVGGMSTVYKARDLRFTAVTRYCAVKEMPDNSPDIRTGQIRLANFEREASLLATLSHPGIPKIYDFFSAHGRVYLVLEFIDGRDLESQLNNKEHPMLEEEVVRLAVQVCDVLEYLHGHQPQPIVFRDLKPSNMIVQPDGKLTLIDFGIAKVFQSDKRGTMIGTEGYAPPEQYRGLAEPRGDIYGLGATMHHLLTKSDPRVQTPFTFHERPIRKFNPRVSEYLESIILQAVEYDIERRWPSAPAFRQALMQTSVLDPKLKKRQSGPLDENQVSLIEQADIPGLNGSPGSGPMSRPDISSGVLLPPSYAGQKDNRVPAPEKAATPANMGVGAEGAQVLWTFTADDEIRSSPLCSRGVVFFGAYDTNLYALNAKSGDFLWKAPTKAGICSSPTLVNDLVIVGSEDGYVYAFDARRGTTSWTYRTGSPVRSSPRVYKDMLFIGSDDQNIYALQAETGQIVWKYRTWNHVRSSATVANGLVMVGSSDGNLYALDMLSGTLKWKMHTLGAIISTPGIAGSTAIIGSLDNYVYGVDVDSGFTSWRFETQRSVSSSPAVMGERVLIGSTDGIMYALDAHSGRTIWDYDTQSQITSSPRISPVSDTVYFGTVNNYIYALDLITGEQKWRYKTRGPVVSSPSIEDGIVYVGSLDRKLYALAI